MLPQFGGQVKGRIPFGAKESGLLEGAAEAGGRASLIGVLAGLAS